MIAPTNASTIEALIAAATTMTRPALRTKPARTIAVNQRREARRAAIGS
jgi:hypothetical protein